MSVKVEQVEKNVVKLTYEVSAEKFEAAMEKSYKKNVKNYNIPGFRKGKAPRKIVEKYYTEAVLYDDAVNFAFNDSYEDAVKEAGIEPVSHPEIDIEQIGSGKPLIFVVKVTVKPEVVLGEYIGIEIPKIEYTVTDEDIDNEIKSMLEKNARMVPVEDRQVQNGDFALIDFEGFVDGVAFEGGKGENFTLEIGSGQFIPGFEEQLIGKGTGDEVEVNVTFPTEYHAAELAGQNAVFKVLIHGIKEKQLPEFDDEFAQETSSFDTADALKENVKEKLAEQMEQKTKQETESAVIEKVVTNAQIDLPDVMVESQIDNIARDFEMRLTYQGMNLESYLAYLGMDMEGFRAQFKEQATRQVKSSLVLEAIAAKEGITASEEDFEAHLVSMAEQYKMELENIKKILRPEDMDSIREELVFTKTVEMLINKAVVKDEKKKETKPKAAAKTKSAAKPKTEEKTETEAKPKTTRKKKTTEEAE